MYRLFALLLICFLCLGCENEETPEIYDDFVQTGTNTGEYWPTAVWKTCIPEEVNMDSELLKDMDEHILQKIDEGYDVHSVIIVKDGYIVGEKHYNRYFDGFIQHNVYSCTKSVTSALVGIAIDKGFLENEEQKMLSFFDDYEIQNHTANKEDISIKHMLTMSAGIEWHEMDYPYSDSRNTFYNFIRSDNMVQYVLDQPMENDPGVIQNYNTGLSHLLSAIVQKTANKRLDSLAIEYLFQPIGITDFAWISDSDGVTYGGSELRLSPRNMARFGYLMLNKGNWDGKQVVSEEWVINSGTSHFDFQQITGFGYGYQYWIAPFGAFAAVGFQGQWIMVFPEENMVIVFTNSFEPSSGTQWNYPEYLVRNFILPSLKN